MVAQFFPGDVLLAAACCGDSRVLLMPLEETASACPPPLAVVDNDALMEGRRVRE